LLNSRLQNIDKAKKELAKLEAEEAGETAAATNGVNGDKDKVADVTKDLKETKIEDKTEEKA
jgi:hypothetical protein